MDHKHAIHVPDNFCQSLTYLGRCRAAAPPFRGALASRRRCGPHSTDVVALLRTPPGQHLPRANNNEASRSLDANDGCYKSLLRVCGVSGPGKQLGPSPNSQGFRPHEPASCEVTTQHTIPTAGPWSPQAENFRFHRTWWCVCVECTIGLSDRTATSIVESCNDTASAGVREATATGTRWCCWGLCSLWC